MTDIEQSATAEPGLAEAVRLRLDAAKTTAASEKPTRVQCPKPFVGYLVENADYAPPPRTKASWIFRLPPLLYGVADAKAERAGFQAMAPKSAPKVLFKVTVMFEVVKGGDHG